MRLNLFAIEKNKNFVTIEILFIKIHLSCNKYKWLAKWQNKVTKDKQINVVQYIQKYKNILEKDVSVKTVAGYEDTIWSCWLQGIDNAPPIIKASFNSVLKNNPKLNFIVITEDNLNDYVVLPDYIQEKYNKDIISKTHLSDYIRLCLLQKYGGTWSDATCYYTGAIPQVILDSEFFQFKNNTYFSFKEVPSEKMSKPMLLFNPGLYFDHTGSSWFLHAKPNNTIINKTKQLLEEYWQKENSLVDYFIFHYFLTFAVNNHKECKNIFNKMPSFNNIYPHILQNVFWDSFDKDLWNEIKRNSFVHKGQWKSINSSKHNDFYNYILEKG